MDSENNKPKELSRKDFLRGIAVTGAGVAVAVGAVSVSKFRSAPETPMGEETIRMIEDFASVKIDENSDILLRMQQELKKALAKPVEERKWLMVIDTRKCVGCHACTIGCISENKLPPGVVFRTVIQEEFGVFPNVQLRFFPRPCMQCENPSCVSVCPVNATWSRPDGVVQVDYDKCIGCRYCLTACPYGARTSDYGHNYTDETPEFQPYEQKPSNEYGKHWSRDDHKSPVGNARKCHFCLHRLNEGELPVCTSTCIGRATFFGDANDPDSLVVEMAKKANQIKLLEEKGTKPKVIYLI